MPIVAIPVRWIESMKPASPRGGCDIRIIAAMTPEQIQTTLNDMAAIISEQAWREMVEKSFGEPEHSRQNPTQGEGK